MFCRNCGNQLKDDALFCTSCGSPVSTQSAQQPAQPPVQPSAQPVYQQPANPNDTGSWGWFFLGFFIPLVGLIMFLVWKDEKPLSAKRCGIGALVGFISSIVLAVLLYVILFVIIFSLAEYSSPYYEYEFYSRILNVLFMK